MTQMRRCGLCFFVLVTAATSFRCRYWTALGHVAAAKDLIRLGAVDE
jgi:hypothetical protein